MIVPTEGQPLLPFWIALLFGIGSLVCYLTLAVFAKMATDEEEKGPDDFNLGVPQGQNCTELFGISLAAAGTPLSTVVAFFIMNGGVFGVRLFLCPLLFATGVWLLYWVYMRARQNGYFTPNDGRIAGARARIGLIPFLGIRLTGSKTIGHILLVVCALPLLGLLTLEIAFGIQIIDYITAGAFHASEGTWGFFAIFAAFIVLLLGYVFVGGFRAVLRSDVWQYKLIQGGVVLTIASLIVLMLQRPSPPHWNLLWPRPGLSSVMGFYVPVIFVNLVLPLGLASSWQRFLAFERVSVDVPSAIWSGIRRTAILWAGLIAMSLLAVLLRDSSKDVSLGAFFDGVQAQGEWFQLFIFPVLTIAALSAMYSCSDTCVSALLYLNEYKEQTAHKTQVDRLPRQYYWSMGFILLVTLLSYWFLRIKFNGEITAAPLFKIAVALYAGLSVLTPTLLLTAGLQPATSTVQAKLRSRYVTLSLLLGLASFWGCVLLGFYNALWSQCATIPALAASSLPAWLLYRREKMTISPRRSVAVGIQEYR